MTAIPVPESKGRDLGLLLALGDGASSRVRRLMTTYAAATAVTGAARAVWARGIREVTYTITVDSADDVYADLHAWVLERVPPRAQRSLVARSFRSDGSRAISPHDVQRAPEPPLTLFYDGRRTQAVRLGPHHLRVSVEQEDLGANNRDSGSGWASWRRDRVVFTAFGLAARDAVLDVLREMAARRNARREVRLFGPGWSDWTRIAEMPTRSLDSVVLATGQKEDLVADLDRFLGAEELYNRLGLPWHRGYLLTGPPGTGKTSIAKVLAQHFGLDIYFLPLSSVPNDGALSRMLGAVPPRSLLLLEDIDIVHGARQRDDSEPGVTLSGLLNGLDGVMTPHGLITVLTTNDETVLDAALVREGRVDRIFRLGYLDNAQFDRLVRFAMGGAMGSTSLPGVFGLQLTPAAVIEALKPHLDNPGDALGALRTMVGSKMRAEDRLLA